MQIGFGFVEIPAPEPTTAAQTEMARKLAEAIQLARLSSGPIQLHKWADHFRLLLKTAPEQEVCCVLNWYIQHLKGEYVPQAYCAETFRKKYTKIKACMHRDIDAITITEAAQSVRTRLDDKTWPPPLDTYLLQVIQISLSNYAIFRKKLLDNKTRLSKRALALVDYLIQNHHLASPASFVERWLLSLHDTVSRWRVITGDVQMFAFKEDSFMFASMGRAWAHGWCGRSKIWDQMMKEIGELHEDEGH